MSQEALDAEFESVNPEWRYGFQPTDKPQERVWFEPQADGKWLAHRPKKKQVRILAASVLVKMLNQALAQSFLVIGIHRTTKECLLLHAKSSVFSTSAENLFI